MCVNEDVYLFFRNGFYVFGSHSFIFPGPGVLSCPDAERISKERRWKEDGNDVNSDSFISSIQRLRLTDIHAKGSIQSSTQHVIKQEEWLSSTILALFLPTLDSPM